MKRPAFLLPLAASLALLQPAPVAAQQAAAAGVPDVDAVYVTTYDTLIGSIDLRAQAGSIALQVVDQMIAVSPLLAETVAQAPQARLDLAKAMRPLFLQTSQRIQAQYRPHFIAVMAEVLTVEEARLITQLMQLPAGQRLINGAVSNFELDETLDEAVAGVAYSREAIGAEHRQASERALAQMTAADTAELDRFAQRNPGVAPAFQRLAPRILDLRVQMDNEPLLPEEQAALDAALAGVLASYGMVLNPE